MHSYYSFSIRGIIQNAEFDLFNFPTLTYSKHRIIIVQNAESRGIITMKKYYPRLIDKQLERKLHSIGCILVSGPKFCGKTTTCERFAKSETKLITTNAIRLGKADPQSCLIGEERTPLNRRMAKSSGTLESNQIGLR